MENIRLGTSTLHCSRLAYGCWRIADAGADGRRAVKAAFEAGYTLFDHADIYGGGESERIFGAALKEATGMRDRIVIATKCGIRKQGDPAPDAPYRFDFSAGYMVESCEQSLKRLGVEVIDVYQLHRPDYLMNPEEVASAFDQLKRAGKVRFFGVSNSRPAQVTALQVACSMPLIVNQVEISLSQQDFFENGTVEQCQIEHITPMAWSPLAGGQLADGARRLLSWQKKYRIEPVLAALDDMARSRNVSRTLLAYAWLLKHPVKIVPIVGSTDPQRIREAVGAAAIDLTREEWYRLLVAGRGEPLP